MRRPWASGTPLVCCAFLFSQHVNLALTFFIVTAAHSGTCTARVLVQIYPDGSGELGWDLDKVGEVAARCDAMPYALRLWREAAALLRAAFSEQRKIMTVVFKAEYFRDDDMHRRMELVRTLGPSLPASVTRALAG